MRRLIRVRRAFGSFRAPDRTASAPAPSESSRIAAIEDRALLNHVVPVFAEQLRAHPQIAILEHAESRDWRCAGGSERPCERSLGYDAIVGDLIVHGRQHALRARVVCLALHANHGLAGRGKDDFRWNGRTGFDPEPLQSGARQQGRIDLARPLRPSGAFPHCRAGSRSEDRAASSEAAPCDEARRCRPRHLSSARRSRSPRSAGLPHPRAGAPRRYEFARVGRFPRPSTNERRNRHRRRSARSRVPWSTAASRRSVREAGRDLLPGSGDLDDLHPAVGPTLRRLDGRGDLAGLRQRERRAASSEAKSLHAPTPSALLRLQAKGRTRNERDPRP